MGNEISDQSDSGIGVGSSYVSKKLADEEKKVRLTISIASRSGKTRCANWIKYIRKGS